MQSAGVAMQTAACSRRVSPCRRWRGVALKPVARELVLLQGLWGRSVRVCDVEPSVHHERIINIVLLHQSFVTRPRHQDLAHDGGDRVDGRHVAKSDQCLAG